MEQKSRLDFLDGVRGLAILMVGKAALQLLRANLRCAALDFLQSPYAAAALDFGVQLFFSSYRAT